MNTQTGSLLHKGEIKTLPVYSGSISVLWSLKKKEEAVQTTYSASFEKLISKKSHINVSEMKVQEYVFKREMCCKDIVQELKEEKNVIFECEREALLVFSVQ